VAHSIGEGLTFVGTSLVVDRLGWRAAFWGPGLLCVAAALVLFRTLADRPEACGLPPVHVYRNDPTGAPAARAPVGRAQAEALRLPAVWLLGLASACMYVARYGLNNWGPLFLQEAKGYGIVEAGAVMGVYPVAGLLGSATSGFVSDRWFRSRRNPPALLLGVVEAGALAAILFVPAGHRTLDVAAMAVFGFSLGGLLVYLGGLMAVDLVPRRATGAAMGIIGLFSYVGAAVQDAVTGWLLETHPVAGTGGTAHDFGPAGWFWLSASVLSILLTACVWGAKPAGGSEGAAG
jgi:OPA family sugar phosphate sensor protein UhpC-like MFS transporter